MFRLKLFGEIKWGPLQQSLLVIALSIVMGTSVKLAGSEPETAFIFIVSPMLLFCALNPVLSVFTPSFWPYLKLSILSFIVLIIINFWIIKFMTGVSPFENGTMAKMFALMVLFYLMTYVAAMLFRGVRKFLENGDQMR